MGLQPPYTLAGGSFTLVALTCLVHTGDVPSASLGGLQSEHLPSSGIDFRLGSLPLVGCAPQHSWKSSSGGWTRFKQMINRGFLALPLTQSQRGLSSAGVRGGWTPVPASPRLGVIISNLGEAFLRCLVEEIHYLELACSHGYKRILPSPCLCHLEPGRGSWPEPGHSDVRAVPTG